MNRKLCRECLLFSLFLLGFILWGVFGARADCTGCASPDLPLPGKLITGTGTTALTVKPARNYLWDPQPDITSYELARALPFALGYSPAIETAPPEVRRHFKETK